MAEEKVTDEQFQKWVRETVEALKLYMNLAGWRIEIDFVPGEETDTASVYASIVPDPTYLHADIKITHKLQETYDSNFPLAVEILVHEMSHILVEPLWEQVWNASSPLTRPFAKTIQERSVVQIARVITKGLPASFMLQPGLKTECLDGFVPPRRGRR
jgi:hypothetical protein